MAGLLSIGESYKGSALSGIVAEGAQQQQENQFNQEVEAQKKMQLEAMAGELGGVGLGIFTAAGGWGWLSAALFA